jgi:heptosyltransferase II
MDSKPKILIIQTAFLGDVILTLPVVQNIKQFIHDAEIDFMCIPQTEEVLKNNPSITNLIVFDKRGKKKISKLLKMISSVRKNKYEMIISPHRSFRSALITHFSGAKIKIGFNKNSFSALLTSRVLYNKNSHEIERNVDLVRAIPGIKFDENKKQLKPELFPSQEDLNYVQQLLSPLHSIYATNSTHSIVSLAPCSKWFTKQLPENKSIEIINELINCGYRAALIGGKEDEQYCTNIEKKLSSENILNLCGKLTPLQSKVVIENSVCLVSVDSAAAHIGASTDTPVVQIYGSTVPAFGFYQLTSRNVIIENNTLACRPCTNHGRKNCPLKHFKCMEDIGLNKIIEAVERLTSSD